MGVLIKHAIGPDTIVFHKTKEKFGGLSNMAAGYPIYIDDVHFKTSEALYQSCKFPNYPDICNDIINAASPIGAKMIARKNASYIINEWEYIKIPVMQWCLEMKLAQNMETFGGLLRSTGTHPIIEYSRNDSFWGAKHYSVGVLEGSNVLGQLLMILRQNLLANKFLEPNQSAYFGDYTKVTDDKFMV